MTLLLCALFPESVLNEVSLLHPPALDCGLVPPGYVPSAFPNEVISAVFIKKGPQHTTEPRFLEHCVTTLKDFPEDLVAALVPATSSALRRGLGPPAILSPWSRVQAARSGHFPGWITLIFKATRRSETHRFWFPLLTLGL